MTDAPLFDEPVTVERLRYLFLYDPETGKFRWQHVPGRRSCMVGRPALACINDRGYFYAKVDDKHVVAHRAAWAIYYGEWPRRIIDHINRDPSDNRICNLRDASYTVNGINVPIGDMANVQFDKRSNKWGVQMRVGGRARRFGYFTDVEEARAAARRVREERARNMK